MKYILFFLFVTHNVLAQKTGIQFSTKPVESVFQDARRSNKPVFVEIYSPECHVCQTFVPTLADSRVGQFYNATFLNTKLDVSQPETRAFLDKQQLLVPSLPMFLYFDPQQNMVHFALSKNSTDEVLRHGKEALNPKTQARAMKSRYQRGERSPSFLIDYAMFGRVTKDTTANIAAMNDYARKASPATFTNATHWSALQKLILDFENPMFQYMLSHLDAYRKLYGAAQTKQVAENILMSSLYSKRGADFPIAKILQIQQDLTKIGVDARSAANRTMLPEINAYFHTHQTAKATERMDNQVNSNAMTVPELIYITRLFNRSSPDASDVPTVTKWINKGLAMNPNPQEKAALNAELATANRRR